MLKHFRWLKALKAQVFVRRNPPSYTEQLTLEQLKLTAGLGIKPSPGLKLIAQTDINGSRREILLKVDVIKVIETFKRRKTEAGSVAALKDSVLSTESVPSLRRAVLSTESIPALKEAVLSSRAALNGAEVAPAAPTAPIPIGIGKTLVPANLEVELGTKGSTVLIFPAFFWVVLSACSLSYVYKNTDKNGWCGVERPSGKIPLPRERERCMVLGYLTPTRLFPRADYLIRWARQTRPGFDTLKGDARDEALLGVYNDFVFYNQRFGQFWSTAASFLSYAVALPLVKDAILVVFVRSPESVLGRTCLYVSTLTISNCLVRWVTATGGNFLFLIFIYLPRLARK